MNGVKAPKAIGIKKVSMKVKIGFHRPVGFHQASAGVDAAKNLLSAAARGTGNIMNRIRTARAEAEPKEE